MSNSTSLQSDSTNSATVSIVQPSSEGQADTDYDFGSLYPRRRTFKPTSAADAVMEYLRLQGIYTATDFERAVRGLGEHDKIWQLLDPDDDSIRMRRIAKALSENTWLKYVRHWYRQMADDRIWTLDDFDQQARVRQPGAAPAAAGRLLKAGH